MSALVAWQRSPSVAQLTQVLHPSWKDSRRHTGLQRNATGVSLPCISIVCIVMEFSQVLTDNRRRQEDAVNIELSLRGDILKMLVSLLVRCVEMWLIQPISPLCGVCTDVNTVKVSSIQVGAK